MTYNPYDHFGNLTNRVARLISRSAQTALESEGYHFPISCVGILADLWHRDGINQKDLGTSLVKTKSSINKMLCTLEAEGLIIKEDDPSDGRGKLIYLTNAGRKIERILHHHSLALESHLKERCTAQEISAAKKVLAQMYEHLSTLAPVGLPKTDRSAAHP